MNATKRLKVMAGLCLYAGSFAVLAVQGLDASGHGKVENTLDQKWSNADTFNDSFVTEDNRVVNVSSRRLNDRNVNAGVVQSRQKAVKEIMVTSKEVI